MSCGDIHEWIMVVLSLTILIVVLLIIKALQK